MGNSPLIVDALIKKASPRHLSDGGKQGASGFNLEARAKSQSEKCRRWLENRTSVDAKRCSEKKPNKTALWRTWLPKKNSKRTSKFAKVWSVLAPSRMTRSGSVVGNLDNGSNFHVQLTFENESKRFELQLETQLLKADSLQQIPWRF